jgi:hypothetical protein
MKLLLGLLLLAIASTLYGQSDLTVSNPESYANKQRPGVLFPHSNHLDANLACSDCHHAMENGKKSSDVGDLAKDNPDIRCVSCHATGKARPALMQAYHRLCIACHHQMAIEKQPSGPQDCGRCHKWGPRQL